MLLLFQILAVLLSSGLCLPRRKGIHSKGWQAYPGEFGSTRWGSSEISTSCRRKACGYLAWQDHFGGCWRWQPGSFESAFPVSWHWWRTPWYVVFREAEILVSQYYQSFSSHLTWLLVKCRFLASAESLAAQVRNFCFYRCAKVSHGKMEKSSSNPPTRPRIRSF